MICFYEQLISTEFMQLSSESKSASSPTASLEDQYPFEFTKIGIWDVFSQA